MRGRCLPWRGRGCGCIKSHAMFPISSRVILTSTYGLAGHSCLPLPTWLRQVFCAKPTVSGAEREWAKLQQGESSAQLSCRRHYKLHFGTKTIGNNCRLLQKEIEEENKILYWLITHFLSSRYVLEVWKPGGLRVPRAQPLACSPQTPMLWLLPITELVGNFPFNWGI